MAKDADRPPAPVAAVLANLGDVPETIRLADEIVKIQGNIFIRELLRSKKKTDPSIRIGITKDEILDNLRNAIREAKISREDIEEWVQEVEGWGNQHVYLYRVAPALAADPLWTSPETVHKQLQRKKCPALWKRPPGLSFPDQLELGRLDFTGERFECVWRRGVTERKRDKTKDRLDEIIDGDIYDFRAYRHTPTRSVMRFEMHPRKREAALFVQIPLGPDHSDAIEGAFQFLSTLFNTAGLAPVDISKAIKKLDKAELDQGGAEQSLIQAQSTTFSASGARVAFSADPAVHAWKAVTVVRQVRNALRDDQFDGDSGKFVVSFRAKDGMKRDVTMSLTSQDKRLYLPSQMTAEEVAGILGVIRTNAA